MQRPSGEPIAIVGMACRFPGADNISRYWQLVREGRTAFGPPPADRWDHAGFYSTSHRNPDRTYAPFGAFVDDVRSFAAMEFGIPPRRLEVMDPQQRFCIEAAFHALQDAGYGALVGRGAPAPGGPLDRRRIGTFVGLSCVEFRTLVGMRVSASLMAGGAGGEGPGAEEMAAFGRAVNRVAPTRAFSAPGALGNMAAAAVAQELDLGGPAFTLDAACASALVAVHDAVHYLRGGQIDAAVAGGVYLNLTPENYICFSRIGAISASGACRPFDARADGFVQGEGVGMVVLRRLDDAIRDGDRIYAVIRGSACNNDGHGDGPMSPRMEGQVSVIRSAWADAGVSAGDLSYVEAHGTGTAVGDRTELLALRAAFEGHQTGIPIGSAKANIGHTMSAAGIAGLIKAALAVRHATIPPLAGWETPHPAHTLEDGVFSVPTEARAWSGVRRATVSSFGFGGTNAHLVLEQAPPPTPAVRRPRAGPPLPGVLVVVSADDGLLLARHLTELVEILPTAGDLAAVARTLNLYRRARRVRVVVVASTIAELTTRLRKAAEALRKDPTTRGTLDRDTTVGDAEIPIPVAFLCPGQGMQRVGLLRDWLGFEPFARTLGDLEAEVRDLTPRPLREYLYAADATEEALTDTAIAQPAMFAIGMAVAAVLQQWGVAPSVVLGHSLGEFTAAALSGAVSARDAIRFVASRGRAMSDIEGDHGAMAAVMAAAEEITPHLPPLVVVANRNHPRQNVISGPTDDVDRAVEALTHAGLKARRIQVSHAFHSPMLEAVQPDVERGIIDVSFSAPPRAMASCIAAGPPVSADDVQAIFQRHATSPVDYVRGLRQCQATGARVYVQLCAGATLAAFARGVLDAGESILSVAGDAEDGGLGLLRVLGLCAAHGHPVDLTHFGEGGADLPPTPLTTQEYWPIGAESFASPQFTGGASATAPRGESGRVETSPMSLPGVPSGSAGAPIEDGVRGRVLEVLARVSAFPADALRDDQRLLDDLGFDSLMVTELSTRLGESFPGFPGIPRSLFAQSPTVADLVRHVEGAGEVAEIPLTDPSRPLELYRPVLHAAPASHLPLSPPARVYARPDLAALRGLTPQDIVVWSGPTLGADEGGAAVAGFVKCLAREWPNHKVCVVAGSLAEAQMEAMTADRDPEVVIRDGVRHVVGLQGVVSERPAVCTPDGRPLAGQRVLLSGGTGWLGRVLARALLDAGVREVILLGTRADASEALAGLGAGARYLRVDVLGDLSALADVAVDGVVHAAGLLADGPVGKVDGRRAYDVKVNGFAQLVDACPGLKWASAIGSYAGRFGSAWQTEYGAANNAMVAVAADLRANGLAAQVQVWGPWAESDMVGTIPTDLKRAMREDGLWFVERDQGARAFIAALGTVGEVVLGLDLPAVRRALEVREELRPQLIWLKDHALLGRPTVPMAVILEWAAELSRDADASGTAVQIEDLTLYDGVVVEGPVSVRRRLEGERYTVWVHDRIAWKGRVRAVSAMPTPPSLPVGGDPPKWDLPTFYAQHTFHGPALRGIVRVDGVGERFVRGTIRPGIPQEWGQQEWTFSPLAIDAAFQLCQFWAQQRLGRAGFPVRMGRWTQVGMPEGTAELTVVATFGDAVNDRFRGDVWLLTPEGVVVGVAEGIEAELRQVDGSLEVAEEHWNFAKLPAWLDLEQRLEMASVMGINNPYFKVLDGVARDVVQIGGRELIHFSGYNYLGFSGHPYVEDRVFDAVRRYGTSVSASRVASGERPIHAELEARLAAALGVEASVVFTAGHATNVTTLGHLFGAKDLILHDELIHDSAFQGMRLSGATRRPFPHGDMQALARMLEQLRHRYEKTLILIEGVYSMDGDICDLPAAVALKKRHKTFLMVDEAHSFGVVGKRGYGVSEHFGIAGTDVDIWMGTLSKSLSSCGGYIAGTRVLVELLKYTAPGFVYSAGLTPANTAAAVASLELMEREPEHVTRLQQNARYFYECALAQELDTGPSAGESAVLPVIVGNSYHALLLSDALMKRGVNVQPILYPAVPDNASRLRFFLSCLHRRDQIAYTTRVTAEELKRIREENP